MSFRPAKLGKDPKYAISDPGYEYIPGVTGTFFGPLAARWGIEGKPATLEARTHLYNGLMPNGRWPFLRPDVLKKFRPVHGGNFHSCKDMDLWATQQPDWVRARYERLFCETANEVVREKILPELTTRRGRGGREKLPAEALAVTFVHKEASGHYHLHVLVEFHNVGVGPDGQLRALDNKVLFRRQGIYSVEFEAKLFHRVRNEFGLELRPQGRTMGLKGLEHLRDLKTPRQEEMHEELKAKGLPVTPKTLHYAAVKTHRARQDGQTMQQILRRTRLWAYSRGVNANRATVQPRQKFSRWYQEWMALRSVKAAVKAVDKAGRHVSFDEFRRVALRKTAWRQADPARVDRILADVEARPDAYGLREIDKGVYATLRTEISRARWELSLSALAGKRPRRPSELAMDRLRLSSKPPSLAQERLARQLLRRRAAVIDRPTVAAKVAVDAFRADNRRVFAVAPESTRRQIQRHFDVPVHDPNELAARLGKTSAWDTFIAMRSGPRWRSLEHVERLYKRARAPRLTLTRDDVLLIDARKASHHALKTIARSARKAKATVILINTDVPPARGRTIQRNDPDRGL